MSVLLKLKVHAGSKEDRLARKTADSYEAWVRAPAERGLANEAALSLLARELGVPAGRLRLIKGSRQPAKIVQVL